MTNYYGMIDLNIKKGDVDLAVSCISKRLYFQLLQDI